MFTDEQCKYISAALYSLRSTGRMPDGRKLRPLTEREMRAHKINWAKRKNFIEDKR